MKIKSIQIKNFRCFQDETIDFKDYSCFVGPNGSGKSTVLAALNVFFRQYKDSKTDLSKLKADDFHHNNVHEPIEITVTFCDLSDAAKEDLSDYVRNDKLIVSAIANYDPSSERADVIQFGNRLGMKEFASYFEADKRGEKAADLKIIYQKIREKSPDLPQAGTKPAMAQALREYESKNPDNLVLLRSEDQFYGATKGASRLSPHVQWIFVPAVKDIVDEGQESKNTGLGQLLSRTIRSKVSFSEKLNKIREDSRSQYQEMLDHEQEALDEISQSLDKRLKAWSHPEASARVLWTQDPDKSVKVEEPWAYIKVGERGFESDLARFGHGMQRSFMLTLLQEIADSRDDDQATLVLGIEEPELYQHPPQARYLADLLQGLSEEDVQVFLCSHSPLFIPGDDFESVRMVKEVGDPPETKIAQVGYDELSKRLHDAGQKNLKAEGLLAKLYPTLNPQINEMFFCKILLLVEGLEDVAYLTSYLELSNKMQDFRKFGCHIVAANGKNNIIRPLAIADCLGIPVFTVFDADADETNEARIDKHKKDNEQILSLLGHSDIPSWPKETVFNDNVVMWPTCIADVVKEDIGESDWIKYKTSAEARFGQPGGMEKNPLAISYLLESAWDNDVISDSLIRLTDTLIEFCHMH